MTRTDHLITPIKPLSGAHLYAYLRREPVLVRRRRRQGRDIASRGREWGRHDSGLPDERPIYI